MPEVSKVDMILDELRNLRAETQNSGLAIARLETSVSSLVGNGQPGRVTVVEDDVAELKRWRSWSVGVTAGAGLIIAAAAWLVEVVKR